MWLFLLAFHILWLLRSAQALISQASPSQLPSNQISPPLSLLFLVQLISLIIILPLFLLLSPLQCLLQLLKQPQLIHIKPIITLHQPLLLNRFLLPRPTIIFTPMTVPILLVKMASRRLPEMVILTLTRAWSINPSKMLPCWTRLPKLRKIQVKKWITAQKLSIISSMCQSLHQLILKKNSP